MVFDNGKVLDLSYTVITEHISSYGDVTSKTNGTGFVGFLMRNQCDIILTPMPMNVRSLEYMHFSTPSKPRPYVMASGPTKAYTSNVYAATKIFSIKLWCLLFILLIVYPSLWHAISSKQIFSQLDSGIKSYFNTIYASFAMFLNQNNELSCSSAADRIAWCSWFTATFCVTTIFTGTLLSVMTLPDAPEFIEELSDILKYPEQTVKLSSNIIFHYLMKLSYDTKLEKTWKAILEQKNVPPLTKQPKMIGKLTLDEVARGREVYIWQDSVVSQKLRKSVYCNLNGPNLIYISKKPVMTIPMSMPTRRGISPDITSRFQDYLNRVIEAQLVDVIFEKEIWMAEKCVAKAPVKGGEDSEETGLKLKSYFLIFYVFCTGILLAIVVLIIENNTTILSFPNRWFKANLVPKIKIKG